MCSHKGPLECALVLLNLLVQWQRSSTCHVEVIPSSKLYKGHICSPSYNLRNSLFVQFLLVLYFLTKSIDVKKNLFRNEITIVHNPLLVIHRDGYISEILGRKLTYCVYNVKVPDGPRIAMMFL